MSDVQQCLERSRRALRTLLAENNSLTNDTALPAPVKKITPPPPKERKEPVIVKEPVKEPVAVEAPRAQLMTQRNFDMDDWRRDGELWRTMLAQVQQDHENLRSQGYDLPRHPFA